MGRQPNGVNFKHGGDPRQSQNIRGANKPWSIRNAFRYIAAQRVSLSDPDFIEQLFGDRPTVAQVIAANTFKNALESSSIKAFEYIDERIEGKLPKTNPNAEWERISRMSNDELDAELERIVALMESMQS